MMNRRITANEIAYLLDHLSPLYSGVKLAQYLVADERSFEEAAGAEAAFFIPLSTKPLDVTEVIPIEEIPVLFPCSTSKKWYTVEGAGIRFHHDILKSAFYLLSGYQEYVSKERDMHGRYPWRSSIQHRIGITGIPVVNYYFEIILEAFEKFSKVNGLEFRIKKRENPVLFLSHDVDRIRKYSLRNLGFVGLQLFGIKSNNYSLNRRLKNVWDYAKGTLLFRKDPYWNFHELQQLERELGITSTWYLLEKTREDNSKYHFRDTKIRQIISETSSQGHEIGIHGTLESSEDPAAMSGGVSRLNDICDKPVSGIRQHYLKYSNPVTTQIQAGSDLQYDATLGFAEQIGFRNSYALPFRLYDFDNSQPFDLWQIPLNVMDVTLLGYMGIPVEEIPEAIRPILREATRFGAIIAMLWHNCNLDDEEFPGINVVYRRLLKEVMDSGFTSMTGTQIIKRFRSGGTSGRS
ncbi:MAG: polysaccharide deacetylase family protein [Bacteroidota bacterium]